MILKYLYIAFNLTVKIQLTQVVMFYLNCIVHKHKMKYGGQRNDPVYHVTTKRNMTG